MIRLPTNSMHTDTFLPFTTLVRSTILWLEKPPFVCAATEAAMPTIPRAVSPLTIAFPNCRIRFLLRLGGRMTPPPWHCPIRMKVGAYSHVPTEGTGGSTTPPMLQSRHERAPSTDKQRGDTRSQPAAGSIFG